MVAEPATWSDPRLADTRFGDVRWFARVDSTNRYLLERAAAGESEGVVAVADEAAAIARTDVSGRTRLLSDFHSLLAGMLGNEVLAEMLSDLLSRCSLIALMFQSSHSAEESSGEHVAIVEALARRDGEAAVALLREHLGNVERNLRLNPRVADLATALQPDTP